ncbi:GNAT family N-acetyltransferase [Shimia ponticola]|uniref:GNAT family N-acetyltransferase n=1 Tax=Shimia ponticola TaxID=2582893 RepID=UPI003211AF90
MFFVSSVLRGQGVGKLLLNTCCAFARDAGYRKMTLWTHESHRAAGHLYRTHGFDLVAARPVHSFGQDLIEQTWLKQL